MSHENIAKCVCVRLTTGPSMGTGWLLIKLEASKGGRSFSVVVVGGGSVDIGTSDPN